MTHLSTDAITSYQEEGYLIPKFTLPDQKLDVLKDAVEELVHLNNTLPPEYLIGPHIKNPVSHSNGLHQKFLDLCLDDEILDMVAGVIGQNIVLWSSGVFCKPAKVGKIVPWHQDGQYWPIRPLATCSVWIAVDDALPENGCMRFIPGSHRARRLYEHEFAGDDGLVLNQQVVAAEFDQGKAIDNVLAAGQVSIHDVYLIHGSNANTSGNRRAGYVMRYMPATSLYDREMTVGQSSNLGQSEFSKRPIWLARGIDCTGHNNFRIGHS